MHVDVEHAWTSGIVAAASKKIAHLNWIEVLLGARIGTIGRASSIDAREYAAVAGWGNKPSGHRADRLAAQAGVPRLLLEDGFLRSVGDGSDPQALSLAVDDIGIYYDASRGSRLERQIAHARLDPAADERTQKLIAAWRTHRLSKYNHARDATFEQFDDYVLVVDQTSGDASIDGALASQQSFDRMLEAALDEYPGVPIVLKTHPDVFAGRKQGHFGRTIQGAAARIHVVAKHYHAPDLLERARAVYVVSSQLGFEALIWGRPVRTFGMPFYAGWQLTGDDLAQPQSRTHATLETLVHAALIDYPRYVDPETGARCEVERVVDHIALQRRMRARFPETICAVGFSRWKKPIARAFLAGSDVHFVRHSKKIPTCAEAIAVWGSAPLDDSKVAGRPVIRVEDGFMRSVGLGAKLIRPLSWVLDDRGIYYDATTDSRLEAMLNDARFEPAVLARAKALRDAIVSARITKYNLGGHAWQRPRNAPRVILVAGQVEGDASLTYGGGTFKSNLELLRTVRDLESGTYLVYKPHPDVVAGLRAGGVTLALAQTLCDEVVTDVSIADVLHEVDEVHVMTSLTGFEALMLGKKVVTYGNPFYAGWGLTVDRGLTCKRRQPGLALETLIAAALIDYPTYVSKTTGRFTSAECVLEELGHMRKDPKASTKKSLLLETAVRMRLLWNMLQANTR